VSDQLVILGIAGSLREGSFNRAVLRAAQTLVPEGVTLETFDIKGLPGFSQDDEANPPAQVVELKQRIRAADAILFVTPEYNYSVPGVLKNAIDCASRPWGRNSFHHVPAAVIGASIGQIGTAVAQQSLRGVLSFCNARQMTAPEAYIQYSPEKFTPDGEVTDEATAGFLRDFMAEFREHLARVLTVIPRENL